MTALKRYEAMYALRYLHVFLIAVSLSLTDRVAGQQDPTSRPKESLNGHGHQSEPGHAKGSLNGHTPHIDPLPQEPPTTRRRIEPVVGPETAQRAPRQGDELLLFREMPVVVSATRRARPINLTPMPVSIVTADDIHHGGQTNLPEILQFVPGVDMVRFDRFRYAVGIRGLHETYSDRTIALINGRSASSPLFGGPEFLRLPVLLDDIERIEVVRGPGGAAWGANAFNGVINIITKQPGDMRGFMVRGLVNDLGDYYTHARYADIGDRIGGRFSLGFQDNVTSQDAITGKQFTSDDHWQSWKGDGEIYWDLDADTRLTTGLAYSYMEQGDFNSGFFTTNRTGRAANARFFARADHRWNETAKGYLQVFSNYEKTDIPTLGDFNTNETDLELQIDLDLDHGHQLTLGGNGRFFQLGSRSQDPQQVSLIGEPIDEGFGGLFVIDRRQISHSLELETQLRGDYYSGTGADWSGRFSAIMVLDDDVRHALRASLAKAYRAPFAGLRKAQLSRVPVGPTYQVIQQPPADLDNEQILAAEIGHSYRGDDWTVRVDGYYQRYHDLIGITTVSGPSPTVSTFANVDGADGYGGELEASWHGEHGRLSAWYTYHGLSTDRRNQSIRAFKPARHKAGLTSRLDLADDVSLNLNYKYSDRTPSQTTGDYKVPEFHRVDLSIAKSFLDGKAEFMVGVSDLFNEMEMRVPGIGDALNPSSGLHETPGRSFFLSMQVSF